MYFRAIPKLSVGCLAVSALCVSARAQELSVHSVDGGGLIQGTALTYKAPKGWKVSTQLSPETMSSACGSPDGHFGYMIVNSVPWPFTTGGVGGPPIGQRPPNSVIDYLSSVFTILKIGKISKIVQQNEKQIPATLGGGGGMALGKTATMDVMFTSSVDQKTYEAVLSCEIQLSAQRMVNSISGIWIVNNFYFVSGPPGEIPQAAKYFFKCAPTYAFSDDYFQALAQHAANAMQGSKSFGDQNARRINNATDKMVESFKAYLRQ